MRWLAVVALVLAACGGGEDVGAEQAARSACYSFYDLAVDYEDGLVEPFEMAGYFDEIVERSRGAEPPELHDLAVQGHGAAQDGDADTLAGVVADLDAVCDPLVD